MKGIKHDLRTEGFLLKISAASRTYLYFFALSHDKAVNAGYMLFKSAVFRKCIYNVQVTSDNLKAFIQKNHTPITTLLTILFFVHGFCTDQRHQRFPNHSFRIRPYSFRIIVSESDRIVSESVGDRRFCSELQFEKCIYNMPVQAT